jgi:hypothetical protein
VGVFQFVKGVCALKIKFIVFLFVILLGGIYVPFFTSVHVADATNNESIKFSTDRTGPLDKLIAGLKNLTSSNIVTPDNNKDPTSFPLPGQLFNQQQAALTQQKEAMSSDITSHDSSSIFDHSLIASNFNQYVKDGIFHILGQVRNTNLNNTLNSSGSNHDLTNKTFTNIKLKITLTDADGKIIGLKNSILPIASLPPNQNNTFDVQVKDSDVANTVFDIKSYSIILSADKIK